MAKSGGSRTKRVMGALTFLVVIALFAAAVMHKQELQDFFAARAFDATPRAEEVMAGLQLTGAGERVFLASQPTVDGSQLFNTQCSEVDHSEEGHILGCFTDGQIHLYDVQDTRVSGIVEVTAAHELLHAVFARMGAGDRQELSHELGEAFEELAAEDPELAERMSLYEHLSDAAFANELHSVLGTEIRGLPPALEEHYATWFSDRDSIVQQFDDYHAVFVELRQQANQLESELAALRTDVEARNLAYDDAVQAFNDDVEAFRVKNAKSGFAADPEGFENVQAGLAERRQELEDTLTALQADIDRYNDMRTQLAELSELSLELSQKLDSTLAPVTNVPDA